MGFSLCVTHRWVEKISWVYKKRTRFPYHFDIQQREGNLSCAKSKQVTFQGKLWWWKHRIRITRNLFRHEHSLLFSFIWSITPIVCHMEVAYYQNSLTTWGGIYRNEIFSKVYLNFWNEGVIIIYIQAIVLVFVKNGNL